MMKSIFLHQQGRMPAKLTCSRDMNISLPLNNNTGSAMKQLMFGSWGMLNDQQRGKSFGMPVMKALMPVDRSSPTSLVVEERQEELGIVKLLEGKSLFVTGSTGFLAKALVETILRTVPNVGKIYVLIRANNKEAAAQRLKDEILNTDLFKSLQDRHGESYERFVMSKLVPVVGNVCETDLGLDEDSTAMMADKVDIIINAAANTSFNQRYDVSINTNTRGPHHVMAFAKKCKNLQVFLHVSTAYVTRQSKGTMPEKLMGNGSSFTSSNQTAETSEEASNCLPYDLDIQEEITLALSSSAEQADGDGNRKMKELGLQRARKYGWNNTYSFTKAMGESLLNSTKGEISLVIIRPTIIEGAIKDPLPGWIEGNRMVDPILTFYGKGVMPGFIGHPNAILDIVPVDMVVNGIVAIIAKEIRKLQHRKMRINKTTTVYQIGSSVVNPVTFGFLVNIFYKHCIEDPLLDSNGVPIHVSPFKLYDSVDSFNADVWTKLTTTVRQIIPVGSSSSSQTSTTGQINNLIVEEGSFASRKIKLNKRFAKEIDTLARLYEPYLFTRVRFDNNNTQSVMKSMSDEERRTFYFDTTIIDWEDYYLNVHSPGLRKHVIKDKRG